jgi:hypothetical protein
MNDQLQIQAVLFPVSVGREAEWAGHYEEEMTPLPLSGNESRSLSCPAHSSLT